MAARFALSATAIDTAELRAGLGTPDAGAFVCFEGWVRGHHLGRSVQGLDYHAYDALALAEGTRLLEEAQERFGIVGATCVHRTGALAVGELAVWVGVTAAHRDAAFAACRWIIDAVKASVPIWKNETYADGSSGWIHPEG